MDLYVTNFVLSNFQKCTILGLNPILNASIGARVVQLAQSCQADMQQHKAMAINEPRDLLPADLLVCTVLLSQSGPDQKLSLSWQQTHTLS